MQTVRQKINIISTTQVHQSLNRMAAMKLLVIMCLLSLFLTGCNINQAPQASVSALPTAESIEETEEPALIPTPILPPELEGDIEIQQLLLTSHKRWNTLDASYTMTNFSSAGQNGDPEITNHQVLISLPASFKVVISRPDGTLQTTRISNGTTIIDIGGEQSPIPSYVFEPFNPPNYPSDTVFLHPLAGFLGSPISDLIFPAGLAQRGGIYNKTGEEMIAGREADIVEWRREPDRLIDRFWVDSQTGVILRQQNYGKESSETPMIDFQVNQITFDIEIPVDTFDIDQVPTPAPTPEPAESGAASIKVLELKGILNVRSGPNTSYKVITTIEPGDTFAVIGRNEMGDWWKIDLDGQVGWVFGSYVEFSGDLESVPVTDY